MPRKKPVDIIETYRRGQQRRLPFTWSDLLLGLVVLAFLLLIGYVTFIAKPEIPAFLKLETLTPTITCECLPTPLGMTATPTVLTAETAPAASTTPSATVTHLATLAPTAAPTETPASSATPTATETPTETVKPTATPVTTFDYTVQEGDTLSAIADRFGLTVDQVMAVNPNLKDASFIYVGQKLKIPIK